MVVLEYQNNTINYLLDKEILPLNAGRDLIDRVAQTIKEELDQITRYDEHIKLGFLRQLLIIHRISCYELSLICFSVDPNFAGCFKIVLDANPVSWTVCLNEREHIAQAKETIEYSRTGGDHPPLR